MLLEHESNVNDTALIIGISYECVYYILIQELGIQNSVQGCFGAVFVIR